MAATWQIMPKMADNDSNGPVQWLCMTAQGSQWPYMTDNDPRMVSNAQKMTIMPKASCTTARSIQVVYTVAQKKPIIRPLHNLLFFYLMIWPLHNLIDPFYLCSWYDRPYARLAHVGLRRLYQQWKLARILARFQPTIFVPSSTYTSSEECLNHHHHHQPQPI